MLSGGMMPVTQLIAMIRSTPPASAAGLLLAMPDDRLLVVLAAMSPADIARLLPAIRAGQLGKVLAALSTDQLAELLWAVPTDQAVALLTTLPDERIRSVVDRLPEPVVPALLAALPPHRQERLVAVLDSNRAKVALAPTYERDVAQSLLRANTEITVPDGTPEGILLVQALGWRIVVAARYGDDGSVAVRDAEDAAYRMRASGALSVIDGQPSDPVLRYCRDAQLAGRPLEVVTWADARHDGHLKRALVGLFR